MQETPIIEADIPVEDPHLKETGETSPILISEKSPLAESHQEAIPSTKEVAADPEGNIISTTKAIANPQTVEEVSPVIIRADSVDMDSFFDELTPSSTQPASLTNPVPQGTNTEKGEVGVDEWINLLSGSSSKASPLSARSSTTQGTNAEEKLEEHVEKLKGFFKYSFDDFYLDTDLRDDLITVVVEIHKLRKILAPSRRGNFIAIYEFIEDLCPKLEEFDSSIVPYQEALKAKQELRDNLVALRQQKTSLVEKNITHQSKISSLKEKVARLENELAAAKAELQEAEQASYSSKIAAVDQEMSNKTVEAKSILSTIEDLEVNYINAEAARIEFSTTWEELKKNPL